MNQFIKDQKVKLDNKVLLIKADKRLNDEEKNKKIDSAMETIMRSEVNAKRVTWRQHVFITIL